MNEKLWKAITEFSFDKTDEAYGFTLRLATEQVWPIPFTENAITEYKKFMYLAATSNQMVSPSPIVDEVWHLHLIYTKSYTEFCNVLGKRIEHIPSTHKVEERHIFKDAVKRTKQLYEENFGKQPLLFWNYINPIDSLRVEQVGISNKSITYLPLTIFILIFLFTLSLLRPILITIPNPYFMEKYFMGILITAIVINIITKIKLKELREQLFDKPYFQSLSAFELLILKHKAISGAVHPAVNNLVVQQKVTISTSKKLEIANTTNAENAYEETILEILKHNSSITYKDLITKLQQTPRFKHLYILYQNIQNIVFTSKEYVTCLTSLMIGWSIFFSIGLVRMFTGILKHKPVAYIVIVLLAFLIYGIYKFFKLKFIFFRKELPKLYQDNIISEEMHQISEWAFLFMGSEVLTAAMLPLYHNVDRYSRMGWLDQSLSDSGGDSGCGSSCGGCGGGCGGCGGD